jgi:hypothetical protein
VIEKVKRVSGVTVYLSGNEWLLDAGRDQLAEDVAYMQGMIEARKGSMVALDGRKRQCNVFQLFLQKPIRRAPERGLALGM